MDHGHEAFSEHEAMRNALAALEVTAGGDCGPARVGVAVVQPSGFPFAGRLWRSGMPYPQELRDRVLAAVGEPVRVVAARLCVGESYVCAALRKARQTGQTTAGIGGNAKGVSLAGGPWRFPRAYPQELRNRVLAAAGESTRVVAAGYEGPALRSSPRHAASPSALRAQLRSFLSVLWLQCRTGASADAIREALSDMRLSGIVVGDEASGFCLAGSHLGA